MNDAAPRPNEYVVVARRYRPQTFDELVGQEPVAQALKGAIESQRVGHAYLFTGARGVGKTSAARILAKALDCERGASPTPCGECEICRSIAGGDDVDVLEIDGASNRGIDEIRQLRQNVAVRPSRARFKIYIIDEVHMLTKEAFNALLKTLEEPPEHVKFIFATTEANKIPITILSRCQRYDFAGIDAQAIHARLADIAKAEGVEAEEDALQIIAIRAAGSMRDSQSLLEQLLATGASRITAADVTNLLGLAPAVRLGQLVEPLVRGDAAAALAEFDAALAEGAEPGQLIDQLLGYFRDVMTQAVGCDANQLLYALPGQQAEVRRVASTLGVETLLAMAQVLDHTAARMRVSTQVRTLAEMALVRICRLHDLDELATLIDRLKDGNPPAAPPGSATPSAKKNVATAAPPVDRRALSQADAPSSPAEVTRDATDSRHALQETSGHGEPAPLRIDDESAEPLWRQTLERLTGLVADCAAAADRLSVDAQGRLVASFPERSRFARDSCLRPANLSRIETALAEVCGTRISLVLATHEDDAEANPLARSRTTAKQRYDETTSQPFVKRAMELFDVEPRRVRIIHSDGQG